jgi:hypothetical protein
VSAGGDGSWREALRGNRRLLARQPLPNEHLIDVATEPTEEVADRIAGLT